MKTAKAWTEEITLVTCPECEETIELGTDIVIGAGEKIACEWCCATFLIEDPER